MTNSNNSSHLVFCCQELKHTVKFRMRQWERHRTYKSDSLGSQLQAYLCAWDGAISRGLGFTVFTHANRNETTAIQLMPADLTPILLQLFERITWCQIIYDVCFRTLLFVLSQCTTTILRGSTLLALIELARSCSQGLRQSKYPPTRILHHPTHTQ